MKNIAFLCALISFISFLSFSIKRSNKRKKEAEDDFWDREAKANSVRKKPLDDLNYIEIPYEGDTLPWDLDKLSIYSDSEEEPEGNDAESKAIKAQLEILGLKGNKIVNLTGLTNTDLKMEYGASNLYTLSDYDQCFTVLAGALYRWADALIKGGRTSDAEKVLSYSVSIGSDVTLVYSLLAKIYSDRGEVEKIIDLLSAADTLPTENRTIVLRNLSKYTE